MVNKHQFQMLAKAFRAGKLSLSDFTEQAFNPPVAAEPESNKSSGAQETPEPSGDSPSP